LEKYGKNREFRFQTRAALKRVKVDIDKLVEYSNGRKASTPFIFCKKPEDSANHAKARMMRPSILYLKGEERGDEISVEVGGKVAYVAKGELV